MNKKKFILYFTIILVMASTIIVGTIGNVLAVDDPSLELKVYNVQSNDTTKVKFLFYIKNVQNIDINEPLAIMANLVYNDSLISNPTITGRENWIASLGNGNNKLLLDAPSFKDNQTIAEITFDVNPNNTEVPTTKISLENVEISNGLNYEVNIQKIESSYAVILDGYEVSEYDSWDMGNTVEPQNRTGNNVAGNSVVGNNTTGGRNITMSNTSTGNSINLDEFKSSGQKVNTIDPIKDATTSNSPIPQTGVSYIIYAIIIVTIAIGVYTFIRDKKFYD